ncbi:hypothetical protein ABIB25_002865 [Nakamurella sp. UYEF19]|uniref:hypothetical protein n=1 Tax=Nakamurella sp. UYEF19 TaxID=1756392 RepID=UPI00339A2A2D
MPSVVGPRLSQPAAEVLVRSVAASMADRMTAWAAAPVDAADAVGAKTTLDWTELLRALDDDARQELARHALDAALEVLDADPAVATTLLPGTTAAVRAEIAQGCLAVQELRDCGFMVAEVQIPVWERLLDAERRAVPMTSLEDDEAVERRRVVLSELGLTERELPRYRNDLRVSAVPALGDDVLAR